MWPNFKPAEALLLIAKEHELILYEQNIRELYALIRRKAPSALANIDTFLDELDYELFPAKAMTEKLIDDPKDRLIFGAAIFAKVDIIISGDKHFLELDLERPQAMTVANFFASMELYAELNRALLPLIIKKRSLK